VLLLMFHWSLGRNILVHPIALSSLFFQILKNTNGKKTIPQTVSFLIMMALRSAEVNITIDTHTHTHTHYLSHFTHMYCVGGRGPAIWIDDELTSGSSNICATFGNPVY
jgi:hypothetical protein